MKHLIITLARQTLSFATFPFIIVRTLCAVVLQTRTNIDLQLCQLDNSEQNTRWDY